MNHYASITASPRGLYTPGRATTPAYLMARRGDYLSHVQLTNARSVRVATPNVSVMSLTSPRGLPPLQRTSPRAGSQRHAARAKLHALMQGTDVGSGGANVPLWAAGTSAYFEKMERAQRAARLAESQMASARGGFPEAPSTPIAPPRPATSGADMAVDEAFVQAASNAVNSRFSDMFKAFQHVDLNHDGELDEHEMRRALTLWNLPFDDATLKAIMYKCDYSGNGKVDYKEFVDLLARDTVAVAAMGKRGMQASEAMGVSDLAADFLGHKAAHHKKNVKMDASMGGTATRGSKATAAQRTPRAEGAVPISEVEAKAAINKTAEAVNTRFGNMIRAFQYADVNGDGRLDENEIRRALHLWNVDLTEDKMQAVIDACDADGDGGIDYKEFVKVLARE